MSSKRDKERQEFLVFILLLYVMGFAFLYSNIALAIVLLGLAFFLTIVAFPSFGKAVRTTVVWLVERAQRKSATPTYKTEETTKETTTTRSLEQEKVVTNVKLQQIVSILENCPLPSRLRRDAPENDVETFLEARLRDDFPNLRRQQPFGHSRFDIEIGDIGIEIKLPKGQRDVDALKGQIQTYLKRFSYVIAFIINYYGISREIIEDFKQDVTVLHGSRVIVIERKL
jgi:hypothetical protein